MGFLACITSVNPLTLRPSKGVLAMTEIDLNRARFNMVEQQIRPWEVLDPQVLDAMMEVPREHFVPMGYRNLAFADIAIPLPQGQSMMPPRLEGRLLQALALRPSDIVLEIGTGSGFFTALLARFAKHVYSVESRPELLAEARERLTALGVTNVTLEEGDGSKGWSRRGPYDAIVLTGSVPALVDALPRSLRHGGRLCAVVGSSPAMAVRLITRTGEGVYAQQDLFETVLPPLDNAASSLHFQF